MKSVYAYASIALAFVYSGSAVAHSHRPRSSPTSTISVSALVTASATGTAYPTASAPANTTTPGSPITAGTCDNCDGVCVTFGATDDSLTYWFNGGPGGSASSFKNKQIGSTCFASNTAGAMFVGPSEAVSDSGVWQGGPSTKFEWSVGSSTSFFDVSVCDGFSVPMSCTGFDGNETPFTTIGGGELCANDCPAGNQKGAYCQNPGSHTGVLAEVPSCFTAGEGAEGKSGTNNYWYYDNISVQSIFTGRTGVVCTVGSISSNTKREAMGESAAELGPRASKHRHVRRAAHAHGAHIVS